jgi:lipopolysaccharide/colanic/teichoic acid biosynthesis glycosyltransferase
MRHYPNGKRLLDLLLCGLVLPLALPLMGGIALLSAVMFRHPVLYSHLRPGYRGRPFVFYKFSTLLAEEEREGRWLSEGERQTRWGKFLRDYSLDELPQLLNILKGDMSWVGPRPLLMEYLPLYTPLEKRRHWVKPGLTGLAQVSGRNELDWEEKMQYDQAYVARISLRLDAAILAQTVATVLGGQRINFGIRPAQIMTMKKKGGATSATLNPENAF